MSWAGLDKHPENLQQQQVVEFLRHHENTITG